PALGHVAHTRRCPALGALGTLRIGRPDAARACAGLRRVAVPRRRAADRAGVARRVLAGDVGAVALIGRAGVAVVGAGGVARLHRIGWAGGSAPRAGLGHVAVAGRRAAHGARRLEGIGGTVVARAVAGLGDVADA